MCPVFAPIVANTGIAQVTSSTPIDVKLFARLIPIDSLGLGNQQRLARTAVAEALSAKQILFKEGDRDKHAVYLLAGEVSLTSARSSLSRAIIGGSDAALYALAHLKPRQYTGTSSGPVSILRVDSDLLDKMLTLEQVSGIEVTEFEGDSSDHVWMAKILQTQAFLRLPAANIVSLFARLQEIPVKTGQIVIRQGDKGDYFYIIKQGRCRVVCKPADNSSSVALADLAEGDSFGEEALMSNAPRNATVAMLCAGRLMRLAKSDFEALLKAPLLNWVTPAAGVDMVKAGAGLVDVRLESEHRNGSIKGSINIPLQALRARCDTLDKNRKYMVYCDTGSRSSAAAFVLGQKGYNVYVLEGGLNPLVGPLASSLA